MKKHIIAVIILLSLIFSFYSFKCKSEDWPTEPCDRQGCFQILGQPQTTYETNFYFHEAVDIVGNHANPEGKSYMKCIRTGYLYKYIPEEGQVILLLDTWQPYFGFEEIFDTYNHIKVTNEKISEDKAFKKADNTFNPLWDGQKIKVGEIIGYMARPIAGEPYGSNAAVHVHYSRTHGERLAFESWVTPFWKIEENPFRIFTDGISSDNTPPIFLNISDSDPDLSYPIDIVDDAESFGLPPYTGWLDYCDSEGDPQDHYDNIIKNRCPWVVKGKVDIWSRAIDFMNSSGLFTKDPPFAAFNIYPVVNRIGFDIKDSNGISIFPTSPRILIDLDQFILDKTRLELNQPYMSVFAPFWDEPAGKYRKYPHPNIYVVTNTDGAGNPQTSGCWDTTTVPNGIYTIEVTVSDLNRNSSTTTMAVEVLNADIYVDDDNYPGGTGTLNDPFGTITQAFYSAAIGDEIYVLPGDYHNGENFPLVMPDGVSVSGAGFDSTIVSGDYSNGIFQFINTDPASTISGFTIQNAGTGTSNAAIFIYNSQGVISHNRLTNNSGLAIYAQDCQYMPFYSVNIIDNLIDDNYDGIYNHSCAWALRIENTTIDGCYIAINNFYWCSPLITNCILATNGYGVMATNNSDPTISYSCLDSTIFDYDWDYSSSITRINNFGSIPYYSTGPLGDHYLDQTYSPCVDYGYDPNVSMDDIYWRTTQPESQLFPSGYYDDPPVDLGYHYPPVCNTAVPTPIPTPAPVDTCPPTPTPDQNEGVLDVIKDYLNDLWTIQLSDPNYTSPPDPEVHVASEADPTGFSMSLPSTKTRSDFEEVLGFVPAPTPSDPINRLLSVNDPDWVTVTYEDDSPVATVTYETGYSYGTPLPSATPTPTTGPWSDTDAYGYTGTAPVAYSWIDATGGTNTGINDDDGYSDVSIPFDFRFYGQLYNSARISANGYLTFGDNGWAFENTGLPWQDDPNEGIYPLWDDLDPSQGGSIYTITTGATPNRQFIVEWNQIPFRNSLDTVMFEIILFESTNEILFQYYEMNGSRGAGISASVGMENVSGTIGLRYSSRFTPGTTYDGLAIQFVPPVSTPTPIATATPFSGSYTEDFESGWEYWTANGLWYLSDDATSNCPPTPNSHSPSKSWHYGRDDACNYDTGERNWGDLVSPLIDLSGTAYLSFYSWSDVEPSAGDSLDVRAVFVSTDDGANWEYCGQITGDEADWVEQGVLLGYIASPARIKFRFDTVDFENNDFRGWYIDDLSIAIFSPTPTPLPIPATSTTGNIFIIIGISILMVGLTLTRNIRME